MRKPEIILLLGARHGNKTNAKNPQSTHPLELFLVSYVTLNHQRIIAPGKIQYAYTSSWSDMIICTMYVIRQHQINTQCVRLWFPPQHFVKILPPPPFPTSHIGSPFALEILGHFLRAKFKSFMQRSLQKRFLLPFEHGMHNKCQRGI